MENLTPLSAEDVGLDHWPVTPGVRYDEDGPALLCDGWTKGYGGHLFPCRDEIHGCNFAELRADLAAHVANTQHYRNPLEIVFTEMKGNRQ